MIQRYKDIEYTLKRSNRKTASIYIERDGRVSVLVPDHITAAQLESLLEQKRRWIYTSLAEWQDLNTTKIDREYVNGEGFLYLGRTYRLNLVDGQAVPLQLKDGYFCLHRDYASPEKAEVTFRQFYREKGKQRISDQVAYFQPKVGVTAKDVRVLELHHHWASCSPDHTLNFHWKCMMAPPRVLDYIVVHELSHIIYPNHTHDFWNEVDKILPDYAERKAWLRINGAGMEI